VSVTLVPSLGDLVRDPSKAAQLPPEVARQLTLQCLTVLAALAMAPASANGHESAAPEDDRLLTVEETAARLGVSKHWLYRRWKKLPFAVSIDSRPRFSAAGVDRFIRQRIGRQ
jgi:predicted DNA-binding transcriptional regulator AlpA